MTKSALPILFTFSNLSFGLFSLIMSFQGNYKAACVFILASGIIDRYDGRVARYLNVSSDLGKELDSLCDLVSFGVAPSILIFNMFNFSNLGIIGYILLLIFPIAGAYRLARYNSTDFDGVFTGIPITAAGTIMAFYVFIISESSKKSFIGLTIILLLGISYLMVSKHKFKKF